jgi:DUF1680 family protein
MAVVHGAHRRLQPLPLRQVTLDDAFWKPRIDINREHTLDYQLQQCEETGRLKNFDRAAGRLSDAFEGIFFNDSDVYKWVEAASCSLATHPDPTLDAKLDAVIDRIVAAQRQDGYLNTYFTLVEPDKKWTNLGVMHELYCAGHLFQAAAAHHAATGKTRLLDAACRFADHIDAVFGPGKRHGMPGHEEIELALMELYRTTGQERYRNLAVFFVDQRGRRPSVFEREIENPETGGQVEINRALFLVNGKYDGKYAQDHKPAREQDEVVGHAVRAMYLYSAMADIVGETGEQAMRLALERLWRNATQTRMYVTGGLGPSASNEGFTEDYHLPNTTAYAETCAAVGNIMWNWRMLGLDGEARFADIMEQTLYNGFLSGLALDGQHYFYVNPLRSSGDRARQGWFGCACCPPNIARILASLGQYVYGQSLDGLWTHLYIAGSAQATLADGSRVTLTQSTDYPWSSAIEITVGLHRDAAFALYLRIPGWCESPQVMVNGRSEENVAPGSYFRLERRWSNGDRVSVALPMSVQRIEAHPRVINNTGFIALQRGPIVYCLEQIDHDADTHTITLPDDTPLTARRRTDLLGGVTVITGEGRTPSPDGWENRLYRPATQTDRRRVDITAVPYYAWNNRGKDRMTVWIKRG